jgi:hypothetical protein
VKRLLASTETNRKADIPDMAACRELKKGIKHGLRAEEENIQNLDKEQVHIINGGNTRVRGSTKQVGSYL